MSTTTVSFWDGIETIVAADLRLLDKVVDAIAKAKADAVKAVAQLHDRDIEVAIRNCHLGVIPYDLGADLSVLYARVYRHEFIENARALIEADESAWYAAQRGRQAAKQLLATFDREHPAAVRTDDQLERRYDD